MYDRIHRLSTLEVGICKNFSRASYVTMTQGSVRFQWYTYYVDETHDVEVFMAAARKHTRDYTLDDENLNRLTKKH